MGKGTFQPPACSPLFPGILLNFSLSLFEGQDFLLLVLSKELAFRGRAPVAPSPLFLARIFSEARQPWGGGQAEPVQIQPRVFRASPLNCKGLGASGLGYWR